MRATITGAGVCVALVSHGGVEHGAGPSQVAGDVYKCTLENERIRACEVTFAKGAKTVMHTHPDHFAYVVSGGTLRLTAGDGTTQDIEAKTGQMFWLPAQSHAAVNIGETTAKFIIVELKEAAPKAPSR